jgi:hypothetical protein
MQIVFIVINFYPSLLLPSFAKATCHYYNYHSLTICKEKIIEKKVTIWYNSNMKQNSKEINHLYIYKEYIFLKPQKESLPSLEHIYPLYISTHVWSTSSFPIFSNFFQNPTSSKENLLSKFFNDKHKNNGYNPQDVPYHTWILLILSYFSSPYIVSLFLSSKSTYQFTS